MSDPFDATLRLTWRGPELYLNELPVGHCRRWDGPQIHELPKTAMAKAWTPAKPWSAIAHVNPTPLLGWFATEPAAHQAIELAIRRALGEQT